MTEKVIFQNDEKTKLFFFLHMIKRYHSPSPTSLFYFSAARWFLCAELEFFKNLWGLGTK
jgi:hypothetical protein